MAELKNTFSWSFSAAEDFEQCRRRRYWSKYAMWGGWDPSAPAESRTAYRLCKMDNRWGLMGQAAENAIMWVLRRRQAGEAFSVDAAWTTVARPFLGRKWKESIEGRWRTAPKRYCCLREHYYGTFADKAAENEAKRQIANQVRNCIANFIDRVLPRIEGVSPDREISIAVPEGGGDVEHFLFEGVKIYAIPDYAYRDGEMLRVHDWKAGRVKDSHRTQLSVYALWAMVKHGMSLDRIMLYVEYLNEGSVFPFQLSEPELETTKNFMSDSVGAMSEYLIDGDRAKNLPLSKEEWELAESPEHCRQCNFYELCRAELESP